MARYTPSSVLRQSITQAVLIVIFATPLALWAGDFSAEDFDPQDFATDQEQ